MLNFLKENRWNLFFLIVICVIQILLSGIANLNDYPEGHDINAYRKLALSFPHFDFTVAKPFFHRLFAPWLVGFLFTNIDQGFFVLNLLFSILFVSLLYYFFIKFGISKKISFVITAAFIFNKSFIPLLAFQPYRVLDLITATILLISFILLKSNKFTTIFILSIIGVLTKEIALLIIPVGISYIYFSNLKQKKMLILFSIYSIILIFIYLAVRYLLPTSIGINTITALEENWTKIISPEAIAKQLFIAFNPLFLLPVFHFRKFIRFNKIYPHFFILLVFVLLSSLLGGDKERLMLPYAPIYYLFIASLFQKINELRAIKLFEIIIFLVIAWVSNLNHIWGVPLLPSREYSLIFSLVGGILVLSWYIKIKLEYNKRSSLESSNKLK